MPSLFPGVALITGAASGIGRATSLSFARDGCKRIVLADRNETGLLETEKLLLAETPDVDVLIQPTDVLREEDVEDLMKGASERFGRVDYCVNCAGILSKNQRSDETSLEDFDRINGVNYRGCWLTSRAEIRQMLTQEALDTHDGRPGNRGSIVNIASQLGIVGRPAAASYCGSKAAVISMTRCDAIDYSKDNIRINCICPGVIDTPMTAPPSSPNEPDPIAPAVSIAPLNRKGTPQEIADCALFLCSSKASFVQGSAMVVDGGYIIN